MTKQIIKKQSCSLNSRESLTKRENFPTISINWELFTINWAISIKQSNSIRSAYRSNRRCMGKDVLIVPIHIIT